ncbi:MAG: type III-A CRISPR-associated protein Csm2 [Bacteroidetes bacterium]|nr:type III-A CRISPR-associated protein Csm2 [Bacteroidota bacterium]
MRPRFNQQNPNDSFHGGDRRNQTNTPKPNMIEKSILEIGIKDTSLLEKWGHYLSEGKNAIKTSQLRKFFGAVKKIQADFDYAKTEIVLLSPKLAYAVGRNKDSKLEDLYKVLQPLIDDIKEDKLKFKQFVNIFEAIVAYHKEQSGDNS